MAEINVDHINPFLMAASTIMRDACQMEMKIGRPYVKTTEFQSDSVIIMIGVTGEMRGQVLISFTTPKACQVASGMMMGMPVNELDELAQSAISELVNMLTANVATNFSLEGIQIDISTPTLMKGEFSANVCTDKVISVEMAANDVVIDMNISLEKI